jgi:two-component system chemotaxis response regulator CheY
MTAESWLTDQEPYRQTKILIVDDDPMTCQLLTFQLEMEGYPCEAVSDPEGVLAAIAATSPAAILLDFHLGDQGGLELLRAIRNRAEYRYLPVVVMSGLDYRQECELAGANGFVLKPFGLQDLITTIEEVLQR